MREDGGGQSEEERMLRPTQYLPPGIAFDGEHEFTFMPDGSLEDGVQQRSIYIEDEAGHQIEFRINGLTGMVRIIEPGV